MNVEGFGTKQCAVLMELRCIARTTAPKRLQVGLLAVTVCAWARWSMCRRCSDDEPRAVRLQALPPSLDDAGEAMTRERLTERERKVLVLLCADKSNKEIGCELDISAKTVVNYVHRIQVKFGVYGQYSRGAFWREVVRQKRAMQKPVTL